MKHSVALLSKYGEVAPTFVIDRRTKPNTTITIRTGYAASMTEGRTAQELAPEGPAALEMAALWKNIKAAIRAAEPKEVAHA